MIKFHEQHKSGLALVSINQCFQLSESACLLGRFCEFNQIQPPNRIFQCGHNSLEWHGSCHAKTLDLESSSGHFHPSSCIKALFSNQPGKTSVVTMAS